MKEVKVGDYLVTQTYDGFPIFYKVTNILKTCYKAVSMSGYGDVTIQKDTMTERNVYYKKRFVNYGSEFPKEMVEMNEVYNTLLDVYAKYKKLKEEAMEYLGKIKYLAEEFSGKPEIVALNGEEEAVEKAIKEIRDKI